MTPLSIGWTSANPSPPLAEGILHVWAVPLILEDASLARWSDCLSEEEHRRASRFHRSEWRDRYVIARGALRHILAGYLGCRPAEVAFVYGAHGKPRLADEVRDDPADRLEFNLAHSGELALVAVARGCAVGIDLERHRAVRRWRQLAERYFHAAETAELEGLTAARNSCEETCIEEEQLAPEPFFRCWTRKEAVVKSIGSGVQYSLEKFRVPIAGKAPDWIELEESNRAWLQQISVGRGYSAAVATLGEECCCEQYALEL